MRLRIKSFELSITYPALCLFSCLIILDYNYLYCICAVFIHEAAHIITMLVLKSDVSGVKISMFDVRILEKSRHSLRLLDDLIITAAGPASNLLMFIVFLRVNFVFALINLFIGAFNLLPAASSDGGQIIFLILSKRLSYKSSALILDIITIIISVPLFIVGIYVLFISRYNFTLLFISLYLVLSIFLKKEKHL